MFLRAGFNARNHDTGIRGWTRHVRGAKFARAELRRFSSGEYFWYGERFLSWGDAIILGTHWSFDLPWEWQHGLPQCELK